MKSSALPEFWECFEQLPTKARRNARKNFLLWQKQPTLKSLGFKRIKHTGEVRIVGKGSWWPGATPAELARQNWWHACGSEKGRWLAADNWHGEIGIFHSKTTRTYLLTRDHRTYGKGTHTEVGWDRKGEQVIFASHKLGNVDVCVATIPQAWQETWQDQGSVP